jgi:nucleoside-diphosphate-sugar epimerase
MERILVLGGTGFLGAHVVRLLSECGHAVCVFNRGKTEAHLSGLSST